jgi:hypothetical protein
MRFLPECFAAVLAGTKASQELASGCAFTPQAAGHNETGTVAQPVQQPGEEACGRTLISVRLGKNIKDVPILIHGPPHGVKLPLHRDTDFGEMPSVAASPLAIP